MTCVLEDSCAGGWQELAKTRIIFEAQVLEVAVACCSWSLPAAVAMTDNVEMLHVLEWTGSSCSVQLIMQFLITHNCRHQILGAVHWHSDRGASCSLRGEQHILFLSSHSMFA